MIQIEEYKLENGIPLTDIFRDLWGAFEPDFELTLSHFNEANTYKLSKFEDIDLPSTPKEGIKLICDVNFLIDVTNDSVLNPFYNGFDSDKWVQKFHCQDGDYILYGCELFIYLIRDNVAYYIGGGAGAESEIQEIGYAVELGDDMKKPYSLLDLKEKYPFIII